MVGATGGRAAASRLLGDESGAGLWLMGAEPCGREESRVGALAAPAKGRVDSG